MRGSLSGTVQRGTPAALAYTLSCPTRKPDAVVWQRRGSAHDERWHIRLGANDFLRAASGLPPALLLE